MKKLATAACAALVLSVPSIATAQTASGSVSVGATVQSSLSIAGTNALGFGTAIAPAGGTVTVSPGAAPSGTGQTLGSLEVAHNSDFSVTGPASITLTSGANSMSASLSCGYSATATGALIGTAAACNALGNRDITLGTATTTFLQVGGTLTVGAGQAAGVYSGSASFTLTAIAS